MTPLAVSALAAVRAAGGDVKLVGPERLKIIAPEPLPDYLVERLRTAKPELLALLSSAAPPMAFEARITELLDQNPAPSVAGRCAWCGGCETDSAAVIPFGTEPGTHAWLHSGCWRPWQEARRTQAVKALSRIGICSDPTPGKRT